MGSPNIVVACLVVVVLAAATVQGQINLLGTAANLTSRVCCSPSGNCIGGAAGLANVTGILSCVDPITRTVRQVGSGISNANGTLTISAAPMNLLTSLLTGIFTGGAVPCILTNTFQLVNQTTCPVFNVVNTTLAGAVTLVRTIPNLLTGVTTAVLNATNLIRVNVTVGAGANV